jgi:hypothetical protein
MKLNGIELTSLSELQAAKWFFLHERRRHIEDVLDIDKDLAKLKDVELPQDVINALGERFEVPEIKYFVKYRK